MNDLLQFPVERIRDNRAKGLLREVAEAIADCDDPEQLRKLGQSLRMLGDAARNKGLDRGGKFF